MLIAVSFASNLVLLDLQKFLVKACPPVLSCHIRSDFKSIIIWIWCQAGVTTTWKNVPVFTKPCFLNASLLRHDRLISSLLLIRKAFENSGVVHLFLFVYTSVSIVGWVTLSHSNSWCLTIYQKNRVVVIFFLSVRCFNLFYDFSTGWEIRFSLEPTIILNLPITV